MLGPLSLPKTLTIALRLENVTEVHAPGIPLFLKMRGIPPSGVKLLRGFKRGEMRKLISFLVLMLAVAANAVAQDPQTSYCNFEDGNQVSVQYIPAVKDQPHNGRVWSPGITLFVQTPLTLAGSQIGLGAYSIHLIPDKKNWTLIVNKGVAPGAAYNSA